MKLSVLVVVAAACGGPHVSPAVPTPPSDTAAIATATPAVQNTAVPAAPAKATKVRSVEGITEYRLDNGLQVLLFPDATQSTITVNVTYLVGSRLEGYGETGMAHLLEHMMFKGSPHHRDVSKLLEAKGGQSNGSTSYDRTNYFETLPASQDNLEWTLDLEADRMIHAEISPADLSSEFSVVRNEFEGGENDPMSVLDERMSETAFLWHNYGKPTIGSRSDIERVPVPALRAFYEKYYQPDDAVLVVSGKFDEDAALASVGKTFGMIPKPARKLADSYTVEPAQDGERIVTLRRNGDVHVIGAAYHAVSGVSPDFPAISAAADMLTREPSGRLYKKLVETKLAASVSGGASQQRDPYLVQFMSEVRDAKNVDKAEQTMLAEIESLGTSKLDAKELERWRTATLKEFDLAFGDSRLIATLISEYIALGDWRTMFAYREGVKKVTLADVQRVAKTYFVQSNRTLGRFVPTAGSGANDRAPLTETPNVADLVKGIESGDVVDKGEAFVATLDNIEARTKRVELAGGIKAALLSKQTRGAKVHLKLRLHWGDEKALQGKSTIATMMGELMVRGTAKKSYQDLADLEDQLKLQLSMHASADGMTIDIETVRDHLAGAIDLAAEIATTPSFPAKEFDIVRQQDLAAFEQQLHDPEAVGFTAFQQITQPWPKSDPRYSATAAESIAAVNKTTLAEIKQFYKDFAGASHAELAVVGEFEPAAVTAQIEKLFVPWHSKKPYVRLDAKAFGVAAQSKSIDIKDKEQTFIALGLDTEMKDSDADYAALLLAIQILGGAEGSRLWTRMREHEGLSYGVQTWAQADPFVAAASIAGYAIVAPQNLSKARAALTEEIAKLATGAIEDKELQHAKDTWIKDQDTSMSSDTYQLGMLANQLFVGRTTAYSKGLRAKLQAATAADVGRVAKRILDLKRVTIVDAGDTSKAK